MPFVSCRLYVFGFSGAWGFWGYGLWAVPGPRWATGPILPPNPGYTTAVHGINLGGLVRYSVVSPKIKKNLMRNTVYGNTLRSMPVPLTNLTPKILRPCFDADRHRSIITITGKFLSLALIHLDQRNDRCSTRVNSALRLLGVRGNARAQLAPIA